MDLCAASGGWQHGEMLGSDRSNRPGRAIKYLIDCKTKAHIKDKFARLMLHNYFPDTWDADRYGRGGIGQGSLDASG
jgi:hypothetical protein